MAGGNPDVEIGRREDEEPHRAWNPVGSLAAESLSLEHPPEVIQEEFAIFGIHLGDFETIIGVLQNESHVDRRLALPSASKSHGELL